MIISIFCVTPTYAFADELDDLTNRYNAAIQKKDELQIELNQLNIQLQETIEKLDKKQEVLDKLIKDMYRNQSPKHIINIILDSKSISDFLNTWDYYSNIGEQQAQQVSAVQEVQEKLEQQQKEYNTLLAETNAEIETARIAKQEVMDRMVAEQATYTSPIFDVEVAESAAVTINDTDGTPAIQSEPLYAGGSVIVERAYSQLGKPYAWGAVGPNSYDCSGLVSYCISGQNIRLGTTYTFMGWSKVSDPQPGDICVNNGHCGIYIGNGQMIHAPQSGDVVKIGPVQSGMIYVRA